MQEPAVFLCLGGIRYGGRQVAQVQFGEESVGRRGAARTLRFIGNRDREALAFECAPKQSLNLLCLNHRTDLTISCRMDPCIREDSSRGFFAVRAIHRSISIHSYAEVVLPLPTQFVLDQRQNMGKTVLLHLLPNLRTDLPALMWSAKVPYYEETPFRHCAPPREQSPSRTALHPAWIAPPLTPGCS